MKKSIISLSTALSLLLFSGCGASDSTVDQIEYTQPISQLSSTSDTAPALKIFSATSKIRYDGMLSSTGGGTLKYVIADEPTNGDVVIYDNGYYTYRPDTGFQGSDTFSYKTDENSSCAPTSVTINVNEYNIALPSAPTELNISTTSCQTELKLSWSDNADNEDGYVIYQDGKPIAITFANVTEQTINFITKEDIPYTFEVRAKNDAGTSAQVGISIIAKMVDCELVIEEVVEEMIDLSLSIHLKNKSSSIILSSFDTNYANAIITSSDGTKAYVSDSYEGIKIIDISNPVAPLLMGSLDTGGYAIRITLSSDGTKAYMADGSKGIKIIDISTPAAPTLLGSLFVYGEWDSDILLSSDGTKAYVAYNGIKIIDVSDPTAPALLGSLDTDGRAYAITLSSDGTKVYVADSSKGIKIINISDPTAPTLLGSVDTDGRAYAVLLSSDGTKAYVADGDKGIKIIDISNPAAPTLLSSLDTGGYALSITLSNDGTKAYVADGDEGIKIIDISNPAAPELLDSLNTDGWVNEIILSNDGTKAYVADGDKGIKIIDLTSDALNKKEDFGNSNLKLMINNSSGTPLVMSVIADRDDIVTLGEYDAILEPNEYQNGLVNIPISSISGATGVTIVTVKITSDKGSITKKIYLKVI